MRRRVVWMVLAGALLLLAACAKEEPAATTAKTQLTMMYFDQLPTLESLVELTYSDIDLVVEQNSSATMDNESERRLQNGHGSDLIATTLPGGMVRDYTYDLSGEEFLLRYQSAITHLLLVNGEARYIPLPGQFYGYVVNQTLIEELGFALPTNNQEIFDIFAAAQEQGLGVGANRDCIGFYHIGENHLANLIFGSFVPDFLSTPEGIIWMSELMEGKAKFSGTAEPSMDFLLHCAQEGYLDAGTVLSSASITISNRNAVDVEKRMRERTMVMAYGDLQLYEELTQGSQGDTYAMLPFLSNAGRPGWLVSIGTGYLAINNALANDPAKLDAALRVLDLISTTAGQRAIMADTQGALSYLKDGAGVAPELPENIQEIVSAGYVFHSTLPNNIAQFFGRQMNLVISGREPLADAMTTVDNYSRNGFDPSVHSRTIVGSVAEDLIYEGYNTRLRETALGNLIADAVREFAGAQMALVNGGGIRSSLYEGEVWDADLAAVCPYSNKIITVEMTGAILKQAIANGITQTDRGESVPGGRFLQVSGVHYRFRPMADENDTPELRAVTLPDGSPIADDQVYTVAITDYMAGAATYNEGNGDGYVMLNVYDDGQEKQVKLVAETGSTYRDALIAYFNNHGEVSAKLEGRITVEK